MPELKLKVIPHFPAGVVAGAGISVTLSGGVYTIATTNDILLPAIAQGDLLYGSATEVLSTLAKNTTATRYLSNTGTNNNPAWAQVALSTGISGFGTGVATFLGTPSSANLAAALTDETGTGVAVFNTSPGFTTAANPSSNDGAALGTTALQWSDLFLAEGGVINWDNGDVAITQTGDVLAFTGATNGYRFGNLIAPTSNDGAPLGDAVLQWSDLFLAEGGVINWANGAATIDVGAGDAMTFNGASNGYRFTHYVAPSSSDGAALGSTALQWSDLFLAEGAVINWDSGDATLTQANNMVTLAGADLTVPALFVNTGGAGLLQYKTTVDFNTTNTDHAIAIGLPNGITRYMVNVCIISGASGTLTTATAGLFTATGGGGVAIVTGASAITVSTASENTNNNTQAMTINNGNTQSYTAATLYFRVANPQGSAATGTVTVQVRPIS